MGRSKYGTWLLAAVGVLAVVGGVLWWRGTQPTEGQIQACKAFNRSYRLHVTTQAPSVRLSDNPNGAKRFLVLIDSTTDQATLAANFEEAAKGDQMKLWVTYAQPYHDWTLSLEHLDWDAVRSDDVVLAGAMVSYQRSVLDLFDDLLDGNYLSAARNSAEADRSEERALSRCIELGLMKR